MDQFKETGKVRTDLHCTNCGKNFIARFDFDIDGNHMVACPYCGHQHCRVIESGKVTGDRWSSRHEAVEVSTHSTWKDDHGNETSSVSHFLRERWINHGAG